MTKAKVKNITTTLYDKFIQDTKDNPQNYCLEVHGAVERHLRDIERSQGQGWEYYFNRNEADRVINIVSKLRHTKGTFSRKHFDIQPYQAFILAMIFGWLTNEDHTRRFQKVYLETARKSGKSEFAAAIEIIMAYFDNENGADVYTVATKKEQANYVFKAARIMLRQLSRDSKKMKSRIKLTATELIDLKTDSIISRLTADSDSEDGANPHCGVVDEFHAHKDDGIYKVVETGIVGRDNPLILIITTAGFNKEGPCYLFRETVAKPTIFGKLKNDRVFALIFTLDPEDIEGEWVSDIDGQTYPAWANPKVWIKANPNIGNTPKLKPFQGLCESAINEGSSARVHFLTKNLNIWTDSAKAWIKSEVWNRGKQVIDLEDFRGKKVYLGLDLSTLKDISAITVLIPPQPGVPKWVSKYYFFCPPAKINGVKRSDNVDYRQWSDDGHIIVTNEHIPTIDYESIKEKILDINQVCRIECLAFDPWNSAEIIRELENKGIRTLAYKQSISWMHPPTKEMERMIENNTLIHDENPVMDWMVRNVAIKYDNKGNWQIDKEKSINKVDGPVSHVVALGGYMIINEKDELVTVDQLGILSDEDIEQENAQEEIIGVEDL